MSKPFTIYVNYEITLIDVPALGSDNKSDAELFADLIEVLSNLLVASFVVPYF